MLFTGSKYSFYKCKDSQKEKGKSIKLLGVRGKVVFSN